MNRVKPYVILLSLIFLALLVVGWKAPYPFPPLGDLLFWSFLAFLLARLVVPLPLMGQVSLHFVAALASAFAFPPPWPGLLAALSLPLSRPPDPWRETFNRSQVGISALLASFLYWALPGEAKVLAAGALYFLSNLGSMLVLTWLLKGLPPFQAWRQNFAPYGLTYLLVSPMAYLMVRLWEVPLLGGWGGYGVLLVVLLLVYLRHMWLLRAKLEAASKTLLQSMVLTLEARDPYTAYHSERVAAISWDVAKVLGLPEAQRELLLLGARLHDVGKVGIPDEVLLKPGRLSDEEWHLMRAHPEMGLRIVRPMLAYLGPIDGIILHHHERWDGRGYPTGLKGEDIPLLARIVAVADAYEAMTSDRPYRKALSPGEAARRVAEGAGTQFDPRVVDAFLQAWEGEPIWKDRQAFQGRLTQAVVG